MIDARWSAKLRLCLKALVYPGPDLNTRQKTAAVLRYLDPAPGFRLLDAGCGNGYFSFLACERGLDVLAVGIDRDALQRCEEFRDFRGMSAGRLRFLPLNLYDLGTLPETFHRIICLDTLEHIMDDEKVLRLFYDRLEPGGRVIIGVPNLDCPDFYGEHVSPVEDGRHVRKGYTHAQLEEMLERVGFTPCARDTYGGGWTRRAVVAQRRCHDALARGLRGRAVQALDLASYLALVPLEALDRFSRSEPLCVLVAAMKQR